MVPGCTSIVKAQAIAAALTELPGVQVLNDVYYTQVCFAVVDDATTVAVASAILADGRTWMSGSRWADRAVIRVSLSNWSTDDHDLDIAVAAVRQAIELVTRDASSPSTNT